MTLNGTITFQSVEMDLSYKEHVKREQDALALRTPKIEGLSPSIQYIEICAPLRSPTALMEDARRDAPKYREDAQKIKEQAARVGRRPAALGSAEGDSEKRAAVERVSRFLGASKTKIKTLGR